MATKTIYKKISQQQSQTRVMTPQSATKKDKARTIISNFIQYLKSAHS